MILPTAIAGTTTVSHTNFVLWYCRVVMSYALDMKRKYVRDDHVIPQIIKWEWHRTIRFRLFTVYQ